MNKAVFLIPVTAFSFTLLTIATLASSQAAADTGNASAPCSAKTAAVTATTGAVIVNSGATVDSYQSSDGAYGGSNLSANGNIVAGGSIINNGGTIEGQQTQNSPSNLSVLAVPASAVNLPLGSSSPGNLNINGASDSVTLAPGSYVV